jgi:pyruvate formate lyase activating enzyme
LYIIWIFILTEVEDKVIFIQNQMTLGMIFDIKRFAIHDGPGIRTAVFLKGCPLNCWWCHNPEGQSQEPQLMVRSNRCKAAQACVQVCPQGAVSWKAGPVTAWEACDQCGKCAEACLAGAREMIGRQISIGQLMAEIGRDVPFYDQSQGGVTFTGGEPLLQVGFMRQALLACKKQGIHTAVDTSGATSWANFEAILPLSDLFLYDVKHLDPVKHKKYTSVSNHKILDNLRKLSVKGANIIVRIPLIPGINDDAQNISQCGAYLASLPHLLGVEIMPYHAIGMAKYQGLGIPYKMGDTTPPTEEQVHKIEDLLSGFELRVIKHPSGRTL